MIKYQYRVHQEGDIYLNTQELQVDIITCYAECNIFSQHFLKFLDPVFHLFIIQKIYSWIINL